jgi:L-ornithine Nalpha-acyltransferase
MWPIEPSFGAVIPFSQTKGLLRPKPRALDELPRVLGRFGNFEIRLAKRKEIRKAQRLRYKVFYEEGDAVAHGPGALVRRDLCRFDKFCDHLLIVDLAARNAFGRVKPKIVGTYRLLRGDVASAHGGFYSAGEFDIAPLLARHAGKKFLELGRSCVHPKYRSKRVIELLWRGLWAYAQHYHIDVLFGCASLPGVNPLALALPLSFLHHHASAEPEWQVQPRGPAVQMNVLDKGKIDQRKGLTTLPPLIKAYLRLGAKFGDGAVIDQQFGTIDVFTVLVVADIQQRYIAYYGSDGGETAAA